MAQTFLKIGCFALLAAAAAPAQRPAIAQGRPSVIRATGEAVIKAQPNQARIWIGVVTQEQSAHEASAQNAQRVDAVLQQLESSLQDAASYRTTNYSIYPVRRQSSGESDPKIIGYTASNFVEITLNDIRKVGDVIDLATKSGANQIQNIQFRLEDEAAAREDALKEAALLAREEAQAMAEALNVRITRILAIEEGGAQVQPMQRNYSAALSASSVTPIEAGEVEIRAEVTITVEFAQ